MPDKGVASLRGKLGLQTQCRFGCGKKLTKYFSSSDTFFSSWFLGADVPGLGFWSVVFPVVCSLGSGRAGLVLVLRFLP